MFLIKNKKARTLFIFDGIVDECIYFAKGRHFISDCKVHSLKREKGGKLDQDNFIILISIDDCKAYEFNCVETDEKAKIYFDDVFDCMEEC